VALFKSSCPVCQYTMPFLERIAASGQAPVVGISQDDAETTHEFRDTYGLNFPLWIDPISDGYRVSNAFQITNVPSIFVVEPDGRVSMAFSGFSRPDLAALGHRFHTAVFHDGEQTPEFRPG
jgi:peroxiredoxin